MISSSSGPFAAQLLADCQAFARYVGDGGFIHSSASKAHSLVSALHVEMQHWRPSSPHLGKRYRANDAEHNSWLAMQQMGIVGTFSAGDKSAVFKLIRDTFPTLLPGQCAQTVFDAWHSNLIGNIRVHGLTKPGAIGACAQSKPTTLATLGLAQKVVNIYLKYAFCWEVAGQYKNGCFIPHSLIPSINGFACALHSPIDAILINELKGTAAGQCWMGENFVDRYQARLMQASGQWSPWSKLECPTAYEKFQKGMRVVAEISWPHGCACYATLQNAEPLPQQGRVQSNVTQTEPEIIMPENINEGQVVNHGARERICISGGPKSYYGLKDSCGGGNAWGALERLPAGNPDGTLCLRDVTIGKIAVAGGNFRAMPDWTATNGGTRRCAGVGYSGWRKLGSTQAAIEYLQKYFEVCACDAYTNQKLKEDGADPLPLCT